VSFLRELIEAEIIDELQITRVETHGDGHPFDDLLLQKHYRLLSSEDSYQSKFEIWAPRKSWWPKLADRNQSHAANCKEYSEVLSAM
jgi:dihydrofolate reductase